MRTLKIKGYQHRIELRRLAEDLDVIRDQLWHCQNCSETPSQDIAYQEAFEAYQALRGALQKLGVIA